MPDAVKIGADGAARARPAAVGAAAGRIGTRRPRADRRARGGRSGWRSAFVLRALIAGAEFAGHLSSYQIGFSYGATIDPQRRAQHDAGVALRHARDARVPRRQRASRAPARAGRLVRRRCRSAPGSVDASLVDVRARHARRWSSSSASGWRRRWSSSCLIVELAIGLISRRAPALSFMVIGYPVRLVVGLFVRGGADRHGSGGDRRRCSSARRCSAGRTAAAFR